MRIKVANSSINRDETRLGLDCHADTTVLGKCCIVIHDFDRPVNVTGYDPEDGSKFFRTVTGVLAYYHPQTGESYLLVINQAIHLDNLEQYLMCPMQCRTTGIKINETLKYQSKATDGSTHDLQVEDPYDEEGGMLTIPFQLSGESQVTLQSENQQRRSGRMIRSQKNN